MADIRLTAGDDLYVQPLADKASGNTVYGEAGDDIIRLYSGTAVGGRGNDRIERLVDPANPGRNIGVAFWDSPAGVEVNLAEGWAIDGLGGRDTLVGVNDVSGTGGDDKIVGNDNGNTFSTNGGHDVFDGRGGYDSVHTWHTPPGASGSRLARIDELDIRVSADGLAARVTSRTTPTFSLTLSNVEAVHVTLLDGTRTDLLLSTFITPQVLAEDTIAAGGNMRWNASQPIGTATALSFSFVTQDSRDGFRSFSAAEQQAVHELLTMTAQITGLSFSQVDETSGSVGQLRFGVSQQTASKGQAALPGTQGELAGDVWIDIETLANGLAPGGEGRAALLHEIGHALGLRHPRNSDPGEAWAMQLRPADDRPGLTVMSSQPPADGLYRADWGLLDVIALRHLYGSQAVHTGDDVYVLGALQGSAATTIIDDGGDDLIDASALASGVHLDLAPGALGSAGITSSGYAGVENLGIAIGSLIEAAIGSPFDDVLIGNGLDNTLTGGLGNDWIEGGHGFDMAVFAGARSDYRLSNAFGKLYVEARDGTSGYDTLSGIERLVFADQVLNLAAAPLGADAQLSVDEDRTLSALLPDPVDVVRSQVSYRLLAAAQQGSAQISADGRLSYTPRPDFNGSDRVAYELVGSSSSNRYEAQITVRPVNDDAPVSRDASYVAAAGATLQARLPAATDADGDPISYAATANAQFGDVAVDADGTLHYIAKPGFAGSDRFGFNVGDGQGGTRSYTATVLVLAVQSLREGTAGADALEGLAGPDGLLGLAGNDLLRGLGGDDLLDGGEGIDTAVYAGARGRYQVKATAFGWTVTDNNGIEGSDSLTAVERLAFADRSVALDLDGHAGIAAQVLRSLFGKAALDIPLFVGVGLKMLDAGTSYADLVKLAIATNEFAQMAGGRSHTAFVNTVYRNVVGKLPDPGELSEIVGLLDSGALSLDALGLLACQVPLNAASAELVGLAATGLDFLPQG